MIHWVLFLSFLFFFFFFASFSSHPILYISRNTRAHMHTQLRTHTHKHGINDFSSVIIDFRDGLIIIIVILVTLLTVTHIRDLIIIDKEVHAKLRLLRSY